ncbi:MAG: hypothetical protein J2P17_24095, partial [Mycobacterium sp.]|nr:hypothetical protein [Mycobacterium sp.]
MAQLRNHGPPRENEYLIPLPPPTIPPDAALTDASSNIFGPLTVRHCAQFRSFTSGRKENCSR